MTCARRLRSTGTVAFGPGLTNEPRGWKLAAEVGPKARGGADMGVWKSTRTAVVLLVAVGAATAGAAAAAPVDAHAPAWVSTYGGPEHGTDTSYEIALSPDGTRAYVPALSSGAGGSFTALLLAYSTATGRLLWNARQGADRGTLFEGVAVDPTGARVFAVGGTYRDDREPRHALVVAYDAATGARRWVVTAPRRAVDFSAVVSSDGTRLYVSGQTRSDARAGPESVIAAYDTGTGASLWTSRFAAHRTGFSNPTRLRMSPDASRLFVSGTGGFPNAQYMTTFAVSTTDGHRAWERTFAPAGSSGDPVDTAVSSDGATVVVTGRVKTTGMATIAYDAATGARRWVSRYRAAGAFAAAVAVSPDGSTAYVTGQRAGDADHPTVAVTVAYAVATGAQLWVNIDVNAQPNGHEASGAVAATPDGLHVVTAGAAGVGTPRSIFVHVIRAADGTGEWSSTLGGHGRSAARAIVVDGASSRVFVTGNRLTAGGIDIVTLAYDL